MPMFDMPISYVSGKQNATRTSMSCFRFTIWLYSPPT